MKLTKSQLRKIIVEELETVTETWKDWSKEVEGDVDGGGTPFSDSFDGRQAAEDPQTSEEQHWKNLVAALDALSKGDVKLPPFSSSESPIGQRERFVNKIQQLMADTREE